MAEPDTVVADELIRRIVAASIGLPGVVAVALGGSTASGLADAESDLDVYLFWRAPLASPEERGARWRGLADPGSVQTAVRSWGLEDWLAVDGRKIELVYLPLDELLAQVAQAYGEGLDSEAFTTALLHIVAHCQPYADWTGELTVMRERLQSRYPEPTYRTIFLRRTPLLDICLKDLLRAQRRGDLLLVQRSRAIHQAIWFNLLFNINRRYHPGEKRMLIYGERCPLRPSDVVQRWSDLVQCLPNNAQLGDLVGALNADLLALIEQHSGIKVASNPW